MEGRNILISPLNWGFGHAGRMLALAQALKARGNEVTFGADRSLIPLIENELPGTNVISISGVRIRYSRRLPQYLCIFLQLPCLIASSLREHRILRKVAASIKPDIIISDNRPGLFHRDIVSVYVTHQVRIAFPLWLRFFEPAGAWLHRMIIRNFDLCLIPDYPGPENLAGRLSHQPPLPQHICYMGPLSRFRQTDYLSPFSRTVPAGDNEFNTGQPSGFPETEPSNGAAGIPGRISYQTSGQPLQLPSIKPFCCLILSGPEPQRSVLLEKVAAAVEVMPLVILTVTPLPPDCKVTPLPPPFDKAPGVTVTGSHNSAVMPDRIADTGVTVFVNPDTATMMSLIAGSALVVTRAGYTTIMELASMGKGAVLIPTPGQTEQEYLGSHLNGRHGFVTIRQHDIGRSGIIHMETMSDSNTLLPDSGPLLEEVVNRLLQQKKVK